MPTAEEKTQPPLDSGHYQRRRARELEDTTPRDQAGVAVAGRPAVRGRAVRRRRRSMAPSAKP